MFVMLTLSDHTVTMNEWAKFDILLRGHLRKNCFLGVLARRAISHPKGLELGDKWILSVTKSHMYRGTEVQTMRSFLPTRHLDPSSLSSEIWRRENYFQHGCVDLLTRRTSNVNVSVFSHIFWQEGGITFFRFTGKTDCFHHPSCSRWIRGTSHNFLRRSEWGGTSGYVPGHFS